MIRRLDAENMELRDRHRDHGVAAELLRTPENFQAIDDVLEKSLNTPFKFSELFEKWSDIVGINKDKYATKIISDLRDHTRDLLIKNGIIRRVGGNGRSSLFRVKVNYDFILRKSKELAWRTTGQDEGTFLMPKV